MSNETGFRRDRTAEEQRALVLEKLNPLNMPLRYQFGLLGLVGIALVPTQLFANELGQFTGLLYLVMFAMIWDVVFAFVLSAAVGGLAGAAYIHTVATPSPRSLLGGIPGGPSGSPIQVSINVIIMSILGGTGTIVGAAVGAIFFGASTAVISGIDATVPVLGVAVADLKPLPLLTAAMVVLVFLPGGLVRFGIRAGRNVLAVSRGEDPEEPLTESFGDSVVGEIVEKYRQDVEEIRGKK